MSEPTSADMGGLGVGRTEPGGLAWRAAPWIFGLLALAASLFVAVRVPPFQGPDEPAHIFRADILTLGELSAYRFGQGQDSGGAVDQTLIEAMAIFQPVMFDYKQKVTGAQLASAATLRWDGRSSEIGFPNTSIYGPLFYLPATEGFALGKVLSLPTIQSLALARILTALACVLFGVLALRNMGAGRVVMAILMLMPMSTFLFGVIDQDGLSMVLAAFGAALMARGAREGRALTRGELWGAAAAFACVGLAKIPYALFSLALLWVEAPSKRQRWAAALIPLAIGLAWAGWMQVAVTVVLHPQPGINSTLQAQYLLQHLGAIPAVAFETLRLGGNFYYHEFIGELGWLDTPLPPPFYPFATAVLVVAVAMAVLARGRPGPGWRGLQPALWIIALAVTGGIYAALYLIWTPVGFATVQGVQGRYLLPVAAFLCAGLDVGGARTALARRLHLESAGVGLMATFGVVALAVMVQAITLRYYV